MNASAADTVRQCPGAHSGGLAAPGEYDDSALDRVRALVHGLPAGFVVFDGLELPKPSRATVDHLVIGPRSAWSVTTHVVDEPVTFGSGRTADTLWAGRTPLRTMLEAADWEATTLGNLIGVTVDPVVCLVAPGLPAPVFDVQGIRICEPDRLQQHLTRSTTEFVDVAVVAASAGRVFGVRPAAGREAPKLGSPMIATRSGGAQGPRRRHKTLGARLHGLRSSAIVRWTAAASVIAIVLALVPVARGLWSAVATEGATPEQADGSVAVPPPTPVRYELTCPVPGAGWVASWEWPGPLPADVAGYSIRTQAAGDPPVVHSPAPWSDPASPPTDLRVESSGVTVLFTEHHDSDGTVIATTTANLIVPTDAC